MAVSQVCRRDVDLVDPDESAWAAAERMLRREVGSLVVLDQERRPVGIITHRDLVVHVMATERSPRTTRVREIMTSPVRTIQEHRGVAQAYCLMRSSSVDYLPVVDVHGKLVGILTLDDILVHTEREQGHLNQARDDAPTQGLPPQF